ncbi:Anthranilate synthase, amidotransferase component [Labilithrix luteola]|uniref:Anthranilate synthase, amidotransferase component n=1 Tax=Labilithrix luteola TaxID=1391654 RepID=A0A0K1QCA9_9BACT|nr:aminodeoxychorismate/anthranilate synthase component II [Labilithrix luteola]AKV03416.1 Anthranilate synthase, amidotransferase component [Labilithrix luteola]
MTTLVIDNYDSFTWNLVQLVGSLGERPVVVRNDAVTLAEIRQLAPRQIILSPGPGHPEDPARTGVCGAVVHELGPTVPILGVCLGHQLVVHAFGGRVVRAARVMHGKTSTIRHNGKGLFASLSPTFEAMRYHSLVAEPVSIPQCLEVTASCDDGTVMAVQHRSHPVFGVQFHPESIGTPEGLRLLGAFLATLATSA